jgi:hypothetical protein
MSRISHVQMRGLRWLLLFLMAVWPLVQADIDQAGCKSCWDRFTQCCKNGCTPECEAMRPSCNTICSTQITGPSGGASPAGAASPPAPIPAAAPAAVKSAPVPAPASGTGTTAAAFSSSSSTSNSGTASSSSSVSSSSSSSSSGPPAIGSFSPLAASTTSTTPQQEQNGDTQTAAAISVSQPDANAIPPPAVGASQVRSADNSESTTLPSSTIAGFQFSSDPNRLYNFCPQRLPPGGAGIEVGGQLICLGATGVGTFVDNQCQYRPNENSAMLTEPAICVMAAHPSVMWVDPAQVGTTLNFDGAIRMYVPDPTAVVCKGRTASGQEIAGTFPHGAKSGPCFTKDGPVSDQVQILYIQTAPNDERYESLSNFDPMSVYAHDMAEGLYTITPTSAECRRFCESMPGCGFYMWYRFGGNCWLKNSDIIPLLNKQPNNPNDPARGEIIQKTPEQQTPAMQGCSVISDINKGGILSGHVIGNPTGTLQYFDMNAQQCCDLCRTTGGCQAISFLQYEFACFLHDTNDVGSIAYMPAPSVPGDSFVARLN